MKIPTNNSVKALVNLNHWVAYAHRTISNFIILHFLILILIHLQEVGNFSAGNKERQVDTMVRD